MRSFFRSMRFLVAILALAGIAFPVFPLAGITLGGKFVPKDSMFLFICAGNSAMSGRAPTPDLVANPRLWKFEMSPANYDWLPAKEPVCVDGTNTLSSPKGGPTMPFLKRLALLYPKYYFGVMQLSFSGGTLQAHFIPGAADINKLLTQANLLKPNVTIAGFISMLNLVEVQINDTANYLQHVVSMVSNVRTQLGLPNLPYIHAGYPVLAGSSTTAQYDTSLASSKSIIRQIAQIPGSIANSSVIPTQHLTVCFTCAPANYYSHYDSAGNAGWGNRAADTVKARTWVPDDITRADIAMACGEAPTHVPMAQKVLFDGSNWSAFAKAGKSFSIFSPSGRTINGMSASLMKNQTLLPGVYFVRSVPK